MALIAATVFSLLVGCGSAPDRKEPCSRDSAADAVILLDESLDDAGITAFIERHIDLSGPGPRGIDFVQSGSDYAAHAIFLYTAVPMDADQRRAVRRKFEALQQVQSVRFDVKPGPNASGPAPRCRASE